MNESFWDDKYKKGGISGKGSVGKYKRWKWEQIINIIGSINNRTIIDVGCGDMRFWQSSITKSLRKCRSYIGIDVSNEIIVRNKKNYPDRTFIYADASDLQVNIEADIVFCLDLLFHILNDDDFGDILINLCKYSKDWIVIYNWINNPFADEKKVTDNVSQYYRNLERFKYMFDMGDFELKEIIKCPFDYFGAMYFYRRFLY